MKTLMILHDGDTGHLRQCEAICDESRNVYLRRGIPNAQIRIDQVAIRRAAIGRRTTRERVMRRLTRIVGHRCRKSEAACLACLREHLAQVDIDRLRQMRGDAVVSTESSVELNLWLSRLWDARSIAVLGIRSRPTAVDLTVVPRISPIPIDATNVVVLDGVPNMMTPAHLEQHANAYRDEIGPIRRHRIGCLLGGDFAAPRQHSTLFETLLNQLAHAAELYDADLLVSTSRRTTPEMEKLVKRRLAPNPRCRLLVIANSQNRNGAVEAILGLSDVVVVSPDSISMLSEAASAGPNVIVYEDPGSVGLDRRFVEFMNSRGFTDVVPAALLAARLDPLAMRPHPRLDDRRTLHDALAAVL